MFRGLSPNLVPILLTLSMPIWSFRSLVSFIVSWRNARTVLSVSSIVPARGYGMPPKTKLFLIDWDGKNTISICKWVLCFSSSLTLLFTILRAKYIISAFSSTFATRSLNFRFLSTITTHKYPFYCHQVRFNSSAMVGNFVWSELLTKLLTYSLNI